MRAPRQTTAPPATPPAMATVLLFLPEDLPFDGELVRGDGVTKEDDSMPGEAEGLTDGGGGEELALGVFVGMGLIEGVRLGEGVADGIWLTIL